MEVCRSEDKERDPTFETNKKRTFLAFK